jgi:branched-chain amino acid transport system permease protein
VLAVVTVSLLWSMLRYTKLGKAIRASTDNWQAATLMGIDVRRVRLYAFGLSAVTAAVAGSSLPTFYLLSPFSGIEFLLKAFAIVVIGGVEDVRGVVIGGLLLGLLEAAAGMLFSAAIGSAFTFAVVLVFLAWRPSGLLGRA